MAAVKVFLWFLKWTVILTVIVFGIHFWITNKGYVFSVKSIAEIAQKHNGKNTMGNVYSWAIINVIIVFAMSVFYLCARLDLTWAPHKNNVKRI